MLWCEFDSLLEKRESGVRDHCADTVLWAPEIVALQLLGAFLEIFLSMSEGAESRL
jgi:hypothetical protein